MMIEFINIRLLHFSESRLSLKIGRGEIVGLAGPNGAGKSSLLRFLACLDPAYSVQQEIEQQMFMHYEEHIRPAMVFQHAADNLIFTALRDDVRFGLKNIGAEWDEAGFRELTGLFRLDGRADLPFTDLSSGERERAAFASIFSQKPDLLLLDEVLSSEPEAEASAILSAVFHRARDLGMTVIFASHEPGLLGLCDRVIRLDRGTVVPEPPEIHSPGKRPFQMLLEKHGITHGKVSRIPALPELQLTAYETEDSAPECLCLDSVYYAVGGKSIFTDLSLSFLEGALYHLTGPSGAGKSTLLMLMAGLLRANSGEIRVFGKPFPRAGSGGWSLIGKVKHQDYLNSVRKQVGYAGQHPDRQLFRSTVFEDIAFAPYNFGVRGEALHAAQVKALYRMGIDESYWQRSPLQLSTGEQRKTAIAGVIAAEPGILLLDDPYAELDQQGITALEQVISDHLDQGRTVVIAEGF